VKPLPLVAALCASAVLLGVLVASVAPDAVEGFSRLLLLAVVVLAVVGAVVTWVGRDEG
jgi:VIT1/CCC1 family predicted Fe2+/Mn2+ transporter